MVHKNVKLWAQNIIIKLPGVIDITKDIKTIYDQRNFFKTKY